MPAPRHRPAVFTVVALLVCSSVPGCGTPPELSTPTGSTASRPGVSTGSPLTGAPSTGSPSTGSPSTAPVLPPTGAPSPSGFPATSAVACAGRPTGAQVIKVVRRAGGLLGPRTPVSVETGPLCSGSWQYTVLSVPQREPLAVVTRGSPSALRLVTAGTYVCSIPVRVEAPPGILAAAACA